MFAYDGDLERLLYRVGMRIFVEHFDQFCNSDIPDADVADMLPVEFTKKSRVSRTAKARRIFREGRQCEALQMIAEAQKVDPETSQKARELLAKLVGL